MSKTVVVVAAHPDDEVLGCGGTIARLAKEGSTVHVLLMADGEFSRMGSVREGSDIELLARRKSAAVRACEILGCASVDQLAYPDNRMDKLDLLDVVKQIESFINSHRPPWI